MKTPSNKKQTVVRISGRQFILSPAKVKIEYTYENRGGTPVAVAQKIGDDAWLVVSEQNGQVVGAVSIDCYDHFSFQPVKSRQLKRFELSNSIAAVSPILEECLQIALIDY